MKEARKIERRPAGGGAGRREHLVSRDALTVDLFRSSGRLLNRGVEVRPPALPRSTSGRSLLRLQAGRDQNVRRAYEAALAQAALAQAAQAERTRPVEHRILRRACGEILQVR
jgi:hypothetical protein